jgi:phosphatidylglycerophosphate synthase
MSRRMIPNYITIARLCCLPVFLWLYSRDAPAASWPTAWLVLALALSDVLDGWLARRFRWQTDLGRVLDPVTDRIFFLFLVGALLLFGTLPWWAVVPLIVRDGLMLAGAALMLFHYHQKPSIMRGGKAANFILVAGIEFFIVDWRTLAWIVYGVGATLYVVTGFRYIWREFVRWRRERSPAQA